MKDAIMLQDEYKLNEYQTQALFHLLYISNKIGVEHKDTLLELQEKGFINIYNEYGGFIYTETLVK